MIQSRKIPPVRVYNCVPDKPDGRDFKATIPSRESITTLPASVDLWKTGNVPEIWNQGNLGSCTAHGGGRCMEITRRTAKFPPIMPSRLFIYYNERADEGDVNQDNGAQIRTTMKTLAAEGDATESLWPYVVSQFAVKPPQDAYDDGQKRKATVYTKLDGSPESICTALSLGKSVTLGMQVYESFESSTTDRSGILPLPAKNEKLLGGHCVCVTGYQITNYTAPQPQPSSGNWFMDLINAILSIFGINKQAPKVGIDGYLIIDNSWGPEWGLNGRFRMPFSYIYSGYTFDAWTIDQVSG